ncbi:NAD(P)H-binding protein [Bifidobacterium thermophilum]|nr:NAD(P)H-binding protein [Bifidobacterium thermophilum]
MKKALLLGGTGAMGVNLSKLLIMDGWEVAVTSRSRTGIDHYGIEYVRGNAHNVTFLEGVLSRGWDAVVDFMIWPTAGFAEVRDKILAACKQYIYLSSYRVFADSPEITEKSPKLLDVSCDAEYLATDEYALAKARQEKLLRDAERSNWTIVRPAITYDRSGRFQLCTLESEAWLRLALAGHSVPLAAEMLDKQTTMSWGGDVALMISRLVGNPKAIGEDFNVCTSKHQNWGRIVEIYGSVINMRLKKINLSKYERAAGGIYQCKYDRMFNRVMDNSKVLGATGLSESDLIDVEEGLTRELRIFLEHPAFRSPSAMQIGRLDRVGGNIFSPSEMSQLCRNGSAREIVKYYLSWLFV